ncbi:MULTISPECIES: Rv3654c family TadE-like protein [Mycolicibacterium]|uniref:Flp pilus-assembly TadE/G-like family protein n=2 Tax=Mycolicibacterium TaxID=1866885 RepID=A0ABT8HL06_MYCAO|nr:MULTISPECIES: Rv3654c family TadE-like protein [Mycolicibacterium]RTL01654.1 MAG: helicase [Xanthomonadales bacterium]MDN4521431.1 flp pilus-assembly TadE/G-like family protein [Mycolicibacterium austroafricanum]QZT56564.1 flp pilus-assembly TadE/G-like family protein [Mycolicibacterium austroafricanum]QZY45701.1 flp pilus-assembly TadE/G-like family protein [Mycolicibacterium austroafricanum]UJL30694.1 flp pilus-assembly TadE/G-like family protein [Mycolicibacterium vanbaalenii]
MAAALMVLSMLAVTSGGAILGAAVTARHRAQAAADLAALSAAAGVPAGHTAACGRAEHVAHAMGARLTECAIDHLDVVVRIEVTVGTGGTGLGPASALARAGPATPAG